LIFWNSRSFFQLSIRPYNPPDWHYDSLGAYSEPAVAIALFTSIRILITTAQLVRFFRLSGTVKAAYVECDKALMARMPAKIRA
jgi:hypothetical protein